MAHPLSCFLTVLLAGSCGSPRVLTSARTDDALIYQFVLEAMSYPAAQASMENGHPFCLQLSDTSWFDGIHGTFMDTSLYREWPLLDELTRANSVQDRVHLPVNRWPCAPSSPNVVSVRFSRVAVGGDGLRSAVLIVLASIRGDVDIYSKDLFILERNEGPETWGVARHVSIAYQ